MSMGPSTAPTPHPPLATSSIPPQGAHPTRTVDGAKGERVVLDESPQPADPTEDPAALRAAHPVEPVAAETGPASTEDDSAQDPAAALAAANAAALATLWRNYKESADPHLREQLILQYSPLVKYVAGRVGIGLPANIEQADLVSYGVFGLIDAIEKFDIERAIKFETYAISRIRGAIIDELRAIDWIPRSVRHKAREVERTYAELEGELRRTPNEGEVAKRMGIKVTDLHQIFSQVSYVNVVALDELLSVGGEKG
ncbi:MAG: sigma-70 family RNA polymerase sigma factor, partial [Angustibacter sp.]